MKRRFGRWTAVAVVVGVASLGFATQSRAECSIPTGLFDFNFEDATQYPACFRDVLRGGGINAGLDVGGTGHRALNVTGGGNSAGATWLTLVDQAPENSDADNVFGSGVLCADVLIQRFDNSKGAGVVTLFNEGVGQKGLALILYNAGNTDRLVLATVEGDPTPAGKVTWLASVGLGSLIRENEWYRIWLTVLVDETTPQIQGRAFRHAVPDDPNSDILPIGPPLNYTPDSLPEGVEPLGQSGVLGQATFAIVNSSITNFTNMIEQCEQGLVVP